MSESGYAKSPPPVPGVHLVKVGSEAEHSLASDVVDILQAGLRGGTDTDVGGVEETYRTTLERDSEKRTEHEFMQAIAHRIRERCAWVDGRKGMRASELGNRDGWRIAVTDRNGRGFAVELTFSEIYEVARLQRQATLSNFHGYLDLVCQKLEATRADYFTRRDGVAPSIH